jgi:hypothetical protein
MWNPQTLQAQYRAFGVETLTFVLARDPIQSLSSHYSFQTKDRAKYQYIRLMLAALTISAKYVSEHPTSIVFPYETLNLMKADPELALHFARNLRDSIYAAVPLAVLEFNTSRVAATLTDLFTPSTKNWRHNIDERGRLEHFTLPVIDMFCVDAADRERVVDWTGQLDDRQYFPPNQAGRQMIARNLFYHANSPFNEACQ